MRPIALILTLLLPLAALADALPYPKVVTVFDGSETIVGEPLAFPTADPSVKALIVSLAPGEATAWHLHGVPLFGYILEGAVTVDYGPKGIRTYRAGAGFLDAMDVAHQGRNEGDVPVRILAVYLLGDGQKPATPTDPPK